MSGGSWRSASFTLKFRVTRTRRRICVQSLHGIKVQCVAMAARVEASTRDLSPSAALINQSKTSLSASLPSGEASKPALGPKPHLMPKPFALQRNATIRPIKAPQINSARQLQRAASSDALDSFVSSKSELVETRVQNTSECVKPNGSLNVSERSASPKPVPLSPKPVLSPKTDSGKNPDITQTAPSTKPVDWKNVESRARAKSLGSQEQLALRQKPDRESRSGDVDVRASSPCWPARNRLSVELTSRFESQEREVGSVRREEPPLSPSALIPQEDEEISGCSIKRRISLLFDRSATSQNKDTVNKKDSSPAEISVDIKQRIKNLSFNTPEPRVRLPSTGALKGQPLEKTQSDSAQSSPFQNEPAKTTTSEKNVPRKNSTMTSADDEEEEEEEEAADEDKENHVSLPVYRRVGMAKDQERNTQEVEKQHHDEQLKKERERQKHLEEERKLERLQEEELLKEERKKQDEEKQRQREEQRKQDVEREKRFEVERKLEEERKREAERERRQEQERLEREKQIDEQKRRIEEKREKERQREEQRLRKEREKERLRKEKEMEEERQRIEEERQREEQRLSQEREKQERLKKDRDMEEKRLRQEREKEERLKKEREMEERRRLEEEERLRQEREKVERLKKEREMEERRRIEEEERLRQEREKEERLQKKREMEERRRIEEEERLRQEREKEERLKKKREMEERRQFEEQRLRQEREKEDRLKKEREMEERRWIEEEERLRQEREMERRRKEREMEGKRQLEEERLRQEREKEERLKKEREMEERRRLEEQRLRQEKERQRKEKEMEEEQRQQREMEKLKKEREMEEKRRVVDEKRWKEREKESLRMERDNVAVSYDLISFDADERRSEVSTQLPDVLYDDFSVKPRKWGTGTSRSSTPSPSREPARDDAVHDLKESRSNDPESPGLKKHQNSAAKDQEISNQAQTETEDLTDSQTHVISTPDHITTQQAELKNCDDDDDDDDEDEDNEEDEDEHHTEKRFTHESNNTDVDGVADNKINQLLQRLTSQEKQQKTSSKSDTPEIIEPEALLFPKSSAPLLDSSVYRSKADLGKKRSIRRSRPSRSVRQRAALPALTEGSNPDWRFCDSTEAAKPRCSNGQNSESEEEPSKHATPLTAPSQPKRVPLFPGMDQSALMAQLKRRSGPIETDVKQGHTAPSARSPRTPTLGPRVLPPINSRDSGSGSSPSWLRELKSKKRRNHPESDA